MAAAVASEPAPRREAPSGIAWQRARRAPPQSDVTTAQASRARQPHPSGRLATPDCMWRRLPPAMPMGNAAVGRGAGGFPVNTNRMILETAVGRGVVRVCGGEGQGATTQNSDPIQGVATQPWAAASVQSAR